MKRVSDRVLIDSISFVRGDPSPDTINLFAIMKNEIYYLSAFFDHYRNLGIEKFYIIDDGSTDGTLDYLLSQPDCVTMRSNFAFGEQVKLRGRRKFWSRRTARAGIEFKRLVPQNFISGRWCIYVDADEFLLLPSQFKELSSYTNMLEQRGLNIVMSAMADFYPESLEDIKECKSKPHNFEELVELAPYFDYLPRLGFDDHGRVFGANPSLTKRLLKKHSIFSDNSGQIAEGIENPSMEKKRNRGSTKISVFKPSRNVYLTGSHTASISAPSDILNCVAHFKFTPDFFRRMSLALESGAWAHGSRKYKMLARLMESMRDRDDSFLTQDSVRFHDVAQLEACGNIMLPAHYAAADANA